MASARRVKQDKKAVVTREQKYVKAEIVVTIDEKVVERNVLDSRWETYAKTTLVEQPDRFLLDLSEEEMRCIKSSLSFSSNSKAMGIINAVSGALHSNPSTLVSAPKDAAGILRGVPGSSPAEARAKEAQYHAATACGQQPPTTPYPGPTGGLGNFYRDGR